MIHVDPTDPSAAPATSALVLGPLLRHVDEQCATLWVETTGGDVVVRADGREHHGEHFLVHGHHYALVEVSGLAPHQQYPYTVEIDGVQVWPEVDSALPAPLIPTLDHAKPLRLVFGSCRTSVSHDQEGNDLHGVDALRAYALRMAQVTPPGAPDGPDAGTPRWPDLVVFLGDQVYADETTKEMERFISSRRSLDQAPWTELKDYEEYAHLYKLAWADPVNRWLLSTVPSVMIFDDHDIRDDWNTSRAWKDEMEATDWWHGRITAGLSSYWVYQHLGNMTPGERAEDEVWAKVLAAGDEDCGDMLDAFADRADQDPTEYRWSFRRDFGDQARLVMLDSRAARVLEDDQRDILDEEETEWLDAQLRGDVDHLLIGTSLPFLLAPGLHYVEAFSEALAGGAWGRRAARWGEKARTGADLEHWAAFQKGFQTVAAMVLEVARGQRGRAPATVTFLSGDVHHSYVSEASVKQEAKAEAGGSAPVTSRIVQAVCSPIRNPLQRRWRFATAFLSYGVAGPIGHVVARSAKVPDAPWTWRLLKGPWFDNNIATLEVTGGGLRMWWATGKVRDGRHDRPHFEMVNEVLVEEPDRDRAEIAS